MTIRRPESRLVAAVPKYAPQARLGMAEKETVEDWETDKYKLSLMNSRLKQTMKLLPSP